MKISRAIRLRNNPVMFPYDNDKLCINIKMKTLEIRIVRWIDENTHKDII